MSDIKVGDTVKIVDSGKCYPTSESLAIMLKLSLYRTRGLNCMVKLENTQAEVVAVGMHPEGYRVTVLGVLCEDGKEYIIDTEGVELVSKADPRAALGKQLFGKKIKVNSTTSRLVQEAVFAAGGEWLSGRTALRYITNDILYCDEQGCLSRGADISGKAEAVVSVTETLSIDKIIPNKTKEEIKKETLIKELERSIMEASDKIKQLQEGRY